MPNFSGIWTNAQQLQATGQGIWPAAPGAPTIGTAASASATSVSVPFTAPTCTGKYPAGVASYTATSTPGCFTASGASSPLTVTGLTTGTSYTFKVKAIGSNGLTSACSAASNSVTPVVVVGQQEYTTPGTYSWVAPSGVTSVSAVVVGAGGFNYGGGSLRYKNNITVVPGNSYTVVAGSNSCRNIGCNSYFIGTTTLLARGGGQSTTQYGDGGGCGGLRCIGGGGAGGYSGNGGTGTRPSSGSGTISGTNGSGGAGGGGAGIGSPAGCCGWHGGGGGGVGLLGEGASGAGGTVSGTVANGGGGGSGGANGANGPRTSGLNGYTVCGGDYGGSVSYGGSGVGSPSPVNGKGAVRIIWPGTTRSFPSTCTGNL